MNVFLVIALHVLSFAALVVVTAAALCAIAVIGRRLLNIEATHASLSRLLVAQLHRMERTETLLADKAYAGYEAEMDAIYYAETVAPPLRDGQSPSFKASESTATSGR